MTPSTPWHPPPGLADRHYDPAAGTGMFLCNPPFMTEPIPLSPAPKTVLRAAINELDYVPERHVRWCIAAALRAAADQVVPEHFTSDQSDIFDDFDMGAEHRNQEIRDELLAIAAELEGAG